MELSVGPPASAREASARECAEVVWHDLECGSYRADLPLWQELAGRATGPILEIGAGTGRVALELARAGHLVTALERERVLLDALRTRPGAERVRALLADARDFRLPPRRFALCVVPMQAIQLLGGASGRALFLRRAGAALRSGGLLACAVLARLEPFACAAGEEGPVAETALIDGLLYTSQPTRVAVRRTEVVIERERRILEPARRGAGEERRARRCLEGQCERSVVKLQRLGVRQLQREGRAAGLSVEPVREVRATDDHTGSTVVMLRA